MNQSYLDLSLLTKFISEKDPSDFTSFPTQEFSPEYQTLITALNQLLGKFKKTLADQQHFAADAAHELKTPIAALKTQAQVALGTRDEAQRNITLRNVIKAADRCAHVVQQLLTLSRLESEHTPIDFRPFDFTYLSKEMIADLAPQAIAKHIEIDFESHPETIFLSGNEIMLSILIRNLVDNAIRYTPPQGEIHIRLEENAQCIILSVIDNGPGIPLEVRDKIFHRFYRLLGNEATGSGLGLAIVAKIVKIHQARISLEDPPQNSGLVVKVEFQKELAHR